MNLGIYLGIGESLDELEKSGQKDRFINIYLKSYSKNFDKVYIFSYKNELHTLPKNVTLIPNKFNLHRYLYSFLIPIINRKQISDCQLIRGFGLTSVLPSLFASNPFIFNWAYDYIQFLKIEKKYLLVPAFRILRLIAVKKADKIFAATESLNASNNPKFVYLPNGVDTKLFKKPKKPGNGIIFVGRLERQKNLIFIINSVSLLPKQLRTLTFLGRGSQEQMLKKYANKKKVSLKILKPVENAFLPHVLSKFSVFALSSSAEGSPKALLEAMSVGLVPVVTNFKTSNEVIKNGSNGYIISFNEKSFAKKLMLLQTKTNLANELSQKARKTVERDFNINLLVKKEIKILKEVTK